MECFSYNYLIYQCLANRFSSCIVMEIKKKLKTGQSKQLEYCPIFNFLNFDSLCKIIIFRLRVGI